MDEMCCDSLGCDAYYFHQPDPNSLVFDMLVHSKKGIRIGSLLGFIRDWNCAHKKDQLTLRRVGGVVVHVVGNCDVRGFYKNDPIASGLIKAIHSDKRVVCFGSIPSLEREICILQVANDIQAANDRATG